MKRKRHILAYRSSLHKSRLPQDQRPRRPKPPARNIRTNRPRETPPSDRHLQQIRNYGSRRFGETSAPGLVYNIKSRVTEYKHGSGIRRGFPRREHRRPSTVRLEGKSTVNSPLLRLCNSSVRWRGRRGVGRSTASKGIAS